MNAFSTANCSANLLEAQCVGRSFLDLIQHHPRPHSTLGYRMPAEYPRQTFEAISIDRTHAQLDE